ncbi:hypothetical protein Prum_076330 [Phytohabitans rumicis]|uniref:Uncharacterized protein n=1 Tax=Phytohabitans rumicis TaxID=1076125 RepID=A0A6V8LGK6_9ACTN|nr:hypothetical protein Prum_076330 [Phytohabitans rumicis]
MRISGWIQPCAQSGYTNGFAFVGYASPIGQRSPILPYESMDSPTSFDFPITGPYGGRPPGEPVVLCLLFADEQRLACLSIDFAAPRDSVVAPVATDDPRVRTGYREEVFPPWELNPTCGTCA